MMGPQLNLSSSGEDKIERKKQRIIPVATAYEGTIISISIEAFRNVVQPKGFILSAYFTVQDCSTVSLVQTCEVHQCLSRRETT